MKTIQERPEAEEPFQQNALRNTVRLSDGNGGFVTVAADELFVSIDSSLDVAYVVNDEGATLLWSEIEPVDAALLVAMGAKAHMELAPRQMRRLRGSR